VSDAGLDYRNADWPRVVRAVYRVRQHYRYTYTDAVTDLRQRLIMVPPDRHGDQALLTRRLEVRGTADTPTLTWETDGFGNRVAHVCADSIPHAVDFEAWYSVERHSPAAAAAPRCALRQYLAPTSLTHPDAALRAAAVAIAARVDDPAERAETANAWAAAAIGYQFGITGVHTPAAMALHLGHGVCQDYAHILLAVLRLLQIPARYVSGHLLGEGAPHAWVEALLPDAASPQGVAVVAYDPTHARRANLQYVTVAVGRDFADVSPTSGHFSGSAAGRLSASKQADLVAVDYADGTRRVATAAARAAAVEDAA
jgi:transglutaminase-like putative cysteine protease